jgi:hypothetical protein
VMTLWICPLRSLWSVFLLERRSDGKDLGPLVFPDWGFPIVLPGGFPIVYWQNLSLSSHWWFAFMLAAGTIVFFNVPGLYPNI